VRILTTTIKSIYPPWTQRTESLPGWQVELERNWHARIPNSVVADIHWAFRLFRARRKYDVVITGFERMACLFALLQRLPYIRRTPHLFLDAFPYVPDRGLIRRIKSLIVRQILLSADRTVAFSDRQRAIWSRTFSLPPEKFPVIPYYAAVAATRYHASRGDYVFAGGDTERDYLTLIQAVSGLRYRVIISALDRGKFQGIDIPHNIEIVTTSHEEYVKLLAGAAVVVVPLRKGTLRFAGQQTYLSAMSMGKPVIVADEGADEYIHNGDTGIIVEPGDALAMREAIVKLMENPDFAEGIACRAHAAAKQYSPDRYFNAVLALAEGLTGKQNIS
jgi:glycosyltransferase involved in cell wall biosynthesis